MRGLAAVVVPWLIWGVLDNGIYAALAAAAPESFHADGGAGSTGALVLLLILRAAYSLVAGHVAARIARGHRGMVNAAIGLLLVTGVVVQAMNWSLGPAWYHIVFLLSIVPAALWGARMYSPGRQD
jgi:hypothetical protein